MNPLTLEWVKKAEDDFAAAEQLMRARKRPVYDAVCFHSQQCVEKYLKARLQQAEIEIPRTHDLSAILDYILPIEPFWEAYRPALRLLSTYAVEYRYPGETADKHDAKSALKICKQIRALVRESLGLR